MKNIDFKNHETTTHELKTWPIYFKCIFMGDETFELRKNDRDFQINDVLELKEYDPDKEEYTGRILYIKVGYILKDFPGIETGL